MTTELDVNSLFRLRARIAIEDRSIPEPNSGCWLWLFAVTKDGYGRLSFNGELVLAHRLSYRAFVGEPGGMHVLHTCDMPSCVNPDHLFKGTHGDNMRDMFRKGRANRATGDRNGGRKHPPKGELNGHAILTAKLVEQIRAASGLQREIAARFNITQGHVSRIKRGAAWKSDLSF